MKKELNKKQRKYVKKNYGYDREFYRLYGRKLTGLCCSCCDYTSHDSCEGMGIIKVFHNFKCHLECKIRLTGNIKHINLYLTLFGKIEAKKKFIAWSKKNIIVANILTKFIEEMEN